MSGTTRPQKSKSQIEEPKLKCSHFIYLTCNHNGWDRLMVETSFLINDQLGAVSKMVRVSVQTDQPCVGMSRLGSFVSLSRK